MFIIIITKKTNKKQEVSRKKGTFGYLVFLRLPSYIRKSMLLMMESIYIYIYIYIYIEVQHVPLHILLCIYINVYICTLFIYKIYGCLLLNFCTLDR